MEINPLARKISTGSLLKFAFPTMVMMVFMNLYTMVDGIFISRIVGTDALSAVNLVSPFLMFVMTIGIMLAAGGNAIIARKMGEGKDGEAKENFSMLVWLGIFIGGVIGFLGRLFTEDLIWALGADAEVSSYCYDYMIVLLFFIPLLMLQTLFQTFLVTAGKAKIGLWFVVIGGLTNVVLDFLFIAVLHMGMGGAALATGIGYSIPGVLGLLYFSFNRKGSLYLVQPKWDIKVIWQSLTNGVSEMVTNLAGSVTIYLFNLAMMFLIGADGVAAISIILYTDALLVAIYSGYSMGIAPLISYNYGERNTVHLKAMTKISFSVLTLLGIVMWFLGAALAQPLVGVFAEKGTVVYELAAQGLPIFAIAYVFMGINIFASALFTALSNGRVSAIISFMRTFVFIVAGIMILPYLFQVKGLWFAVPAAELLSLVISLIYLKKYQQVYRY